MKPALVIAWIDLVSPTADAIIRSHATASDYASIAGRGPRAAHRSLLGRALIRHLLAETLAISDVIINIDPRGKPEAHEAGSAIPIAISIAHSGTMVGAAVSRSGQVGLDIERHDGRRDRASIAAYTFGPQEVRRAESGGVAAFYRIWTLREAMAKATGAGLAQAADGVDRMDSGPEEGIWWADTVGWQVGHRTTRSGYSVAFARQADEVAPVSGGCDDQVDWREVGG